MRPCAPNCRSHSAPDVLLGHQAPVPAVGAAVPVIAHHKEVSFLHNLWTEEVVAAKLGGHVRVVLEYVVDIDAPVDDTDRIAFLRDHTLDERHDWIQWIVQRDDILSPWFAESIGQRADEDVIAVPEERRHRIAIDARVMEGCADLDEHQRP